MHISVFVCVQFVVMVVTRVWSKKIPVCQTDRWYIRIFLINSLWSDNAKQSESLDLLQDYFENRSSNLLNDI